MFYLRARNRTCKWAHLSISLFSRQNIIKDVKKKKLITYMQTFIKTFGFAYRHLFSVLFSSVSRYLVLGHG